MLEHIPFPRAPLRLPTVLSPEEVTQLIDAAPNLLYRTILMTPYSTGMRRAELVQLRAADIDKELMQVHIREGKGKRDRNVPLSPKLLDAPREYWRWMKPVTYVFPGVVNGKRVDAPVSDKIVWHACRVAAQHAVITKRVHPHMLRERTAYSRYQNRGSFPRARAALAAHPQHPPTKTTINFYQKKLSELLAAHLTLADVALEALRESVRQRKATISQIWRFAEICRVSKVMGPYLESPT
jgi:integrase/recombinase XerD